MASEQQHDWDMIEKHEQKEAKEASKPTIALQGDWVMCSYKGNGSIFTIELAPSMDTYLREKAEQTARAERKKRVYEAEMRLMNKNVVVAPKKTPGTTPSGRIRPPALELGELPFRIDKEGDEMGGRQEKE
ncbi:hypothetical protein PV11_00515 [Exophiala sideris]|uniref:Uncharacterized protein n=1 Tax=Exophiala sideris TaxID=1016849 RepID=A0A0D1XA51_9EURO|nr:hypothetical protein PV11_00515 [Exophiala sideris]